MAKFWEDIKFGMGLGIGLMFAYVLLQLIVWLLSLALRGAHLVNTIQLLN